MNRKRIEKIAKRILSFEEEIGLRWQEFDRKDRAVTKEKFFKSQEERERFIDKLEKKDNFYQIVATVG